MAGSLTCASRQSHPNMHTERNTTHKGSQREPARVWYSSPIARYGRQGTDATGHGKVVCVSSLSTLASRSAEDDAVRRPCWAEMKQPNPLRQMTPDGIQPVLRAFAANRGLSIHLYEPAGTQYAPFPLRRHTLARPCWLSSPGPANRGSPEIASAAQLTVPFVDGRPIGSLLPRARRHSRAVQRSDRRLLQVLSNPLRQGRPSCWHRDARRACFRVVKVYCYVSLASVSWRGSSSRAMP